jgi:hypothetical protein
MKTIEIYDVLKVIDIHQSQVSKQTISFLSEYYTAYKDNECNEPMISICSANESDALSKPKSKLVSKEIKQLAKLAEKHNAAYVRFVIF